MRTKTCGKPQTVLQFGVVAARREVEVAQFGVLLLVVGDGWNSSGLQAVKHAGIFDTDGHRVTGEALGVGNHELVGRIAKGVAKRLDLRLGRTASGRGVGFVREEHGVGRHGVAVKAPTSLHVGDESVDDLAHVLNIEASAVIGRIRRGRTEHFCNGLDAALLRFRMAFNDKGGGAHAEDQAVAAAVKRQRRFLDDVVRGRSTRGGKAAGDPFPQVIARDIVTADDDHAVHTSSVEPILCYAKGRCGRGAGKVDGGVWPTNARVLSKLGMPHVEGLEEVAAVKATLAVVTAGLGVLDAHLKARETRGEHDARPLTLHLRNLPVSNQTEATFAHLLNRCQRNARIAQGQQTSGHGQLSADVPCENGLGVNAELLGQIKGTFQACKLRDVAKHLGLVHVHRAVSTLDEPDDVLVQQSLFVFVRHFADARLTADEFLERILGKHTIHAGQAKRDARDHVRINIPPRSRLEGGNRLDGGCLERSR